MSQRNFVNFGKPNSHYIGMKLVQQTFILLKLPVVPNDHIESHRLLALHIRFTVFEITCCNFGTVVWLWGKTPLKWQKLIWKSMSRLPYTKRICTCIQNNWMKALGRPEFTNLVAFMYITFHVVLKEVLCDF